MVSHDPGHGLHSANIVLGRIALKSGQVEQAECRLRDAFPLSVRDPALRTYGPDLELAHELLERGSRDVVLEYLRAWRKPWRVGRELIDWWTQQIVEGRPARVDKWKYMRTRKVWDFIPGLGRS